MTNNWLSGKEQYGIPRITNCKWGLICLNPNPSELVLHKQVDYFAAIIFMKGEYFIVLLCHLPNARFCCAANRSKMLYSRTLNTGKGEFKANLVSLTKVSGISWLISNRRTSLFFFLSFFFQKKKESFCHCILVLLRVDIFCFFSKFLTETFLHTKARLFLP